MNLLLNPMYVTPKQREKKVNYLKQFKKEYNDMTTAEKIMSMSLYSIEYKNLNILRNLGALESTLIMVDVLKPGEPLPNDKSYMNYMLEKTKEYLTKSGCYEENKTN